MNIYLSLPLSSTRYITGDSNTSTPSTNIVDSFTRTRAERHALEEARYRARDL